MSQRISPSHRATQGLHALLAALLAVADRALCTHTALRMPCYLKNGINEPRSRSVRPWCHSSSRRAHRVLPDSRSAAFAYVVYNLLGIGCPRRSRSLRCGEQCIASRSMSNGYIFIQRFSATWTTSARPQRESERRAWTSATRTTMWARAVRRVSVVYAAGRV